MRQKKVARQKIEGKQCHVNKKHQVEGFVVTFMSHV